MYKLEEWGQTATLPDLLHQPVRTSLPFAW